jgi:copper oxidase (laccase) domain-containing protein
MAASVAGSKSVERKRAAKRRPRVRVISEWPLRRAGSLRVLETPRLAQLGWLTHGFSTRSGGTSELETDRGLDGPGGQTLNLGFTDWDLRERVGENRRRFFSAIGAGKMRVVTLRQIHSDIVRLVDSLEQAPAGQELKGDALVTRERGVLLVVETADCIPILLADGPGIERCCYEVGSDVAREFHAQFSDAGEWFDGPFDSLLAGDNDPSWLPWLTMMPPGHQPPAPRVRLSLAAANRAILTRAGVAPERISSSRLCTACRTDLFFSYRRERTTGRLMGAIGIRPL